MIAYAITDGLGNQLFQYATARMLSTINGSCKLYLDLSFYREPSSPLRRYCLDQFKIQYDGFFDQDKSTVIEKENPHLPKHVKMNYFSSPLLWDPRVLVLRGDVHVQSFGQNWRHIQRIESALRAELQFVYEPNEKNQEILKAIQASSSVSIHIRRGDYLNAGYEVCPIEYYQKAMSYMRERIPNVRFFLFSDTPEWEIEQFSKFDDVKYITHNSTDECWEDLRLMASCKGHIIANSTFSWWGAWLNPSPQKIVLAPSIWKKVGCPSRYMIPPQWIKISSDERKQVNEIVTYGAA
jgi:hypothetical protein